MGGIINTNPLPLPDYRFAVFISVFHMIPLVTDFRFQSVGPLSVSRSVSWADGQPKVSAESGKTITLKRGLTSVLDGKRSALSALNLLQLAFWKTRKLRFDMLVMSIDQKDIPKAAWKVNNAILSEIKWGELSADGGKYLIEEMTFSYDDMVPFVL